MDSLSVTFDYYNKCLRILATLNLKYLHLKVETVMAYQHGLLVRICPLKVTYINGWCPNITKIPNEALL